MNIASVSFGKDSLAMLLYILEHDIPLQEVGFFNTGMEFDCIYRIRDKIVPLLESRGIKFRELHPKVPFIYDMLYRDIYSHKNGHHIGYGWCGGCCRWGTGRKMEALDKWERECGKIDKKFVGIAADETTRLSRLRSPIVPLLAQVGMTEKDCIAYCRKRGYSWMEGDIDLYDIMDRVSCWCCANKNRKELFNMYRYLPKYWDRLKALQMQIKRPMKRFTNRKYGEYGDVRDMEKVFEIESNE